MPCCDFWYRRSKMAPYHKRIALVAQTKSGYQSDRWCRNSTVGPLLLCPDLLQSAAPVSRERSGMLNSSWRSDARLTLEGFSYPAGSRARTFEKGKYRPWPASILSDRSTPVPRRAVHASNPSHEIDEDQRVSQVQVHGVEQILFCAHRLHPRAAKGSISQR